jgi:peptidase A4-like protein
MTVVKAAPSLPRIIGRRYIGILALAALAAFVLLPTAGAAAARGAPKHKVGRGTSTNWSGYAVPGTGATGVTASWTQPTAICSAGENSWSSPWVGIDGDNSNTVEQIGTDTDCSNGAPRYYAWYEMYPKPLNLINTVPVSPGNSFTATVTYSASTKGFTMTLRNNSTGNSFTTTQISKKARRSSIEWVMEGPYNGLLTHFRTNGADTIPFTSASGTISGVTGNLGSFSNRDPITMVDQQGTTRAVPTAVSGGTSFNVNWLHL